jgi:diacylglycerol kinase family enzyme
MRVRVVYNASSGYGKAAALADAFARALGACGHEVQSRPIGESPRVAMANLQSVELLVLLGGDGTVHHSLPAAIQSRVPIYHVPTGTENLFARDWGMNTHVATLREAIRRWRLIDADAGSLDGRPFALMSSVGFDAAIIHARCAGSRKGDGHMAYLLPMLEQLAEPVFPSLRIWLDGQVVVQSGQGVAIVANSRQYAMRLDPAIHARNQDGLLDLVFLPCSTPLGAASWTIATRLGRHVGLPGLLYKQGKEVRIESSTPVPVQIDGEPVGKWPLSGGINGSRASSSISMAFTIQPGAVRVLDARSVVMQPIEPAAVSSVETTS